MAARGAFLDEVDIDVVAGSGGRGAVSFRREKYVPHGGPDGGDGGRGGDVVLVADSQDATLTAFRDRRRFAATNGAPGEGGKRAGRDGETLIVHVPPGTVVRDGDELLADLDRPGARVVVARGGHGGRGNARFATSTHQAPRIGELGAPAERRRLHLELKLIADAGLVGLPNAGKSTLLARLTGAHPKIAAYPFTTLHPNLGVAELPDGRTVVLADVPGLIEGAHEGAGLGVEFLRHTERTRVLVHVVDVSAGVEAAREAVDVIHDELRSFSTALAERSELLVLNKIDLPEAREHAATLQAEWPAAIAISAATGESCDVLLRALEEAVTRPLPLEAEAQPVGEHRVYRHRARTAPVVTREGDAFRVHAEPAERAVVLTDMESEEAVSRLQRRLRALGVDAALAAAGCRDGDTVRIGAIEFTYASDGEA